MQKSGVLDPASLTVKSTVGSAALFFAAIASASERGVDDSRRMESGSDMPKSRSMPASSVSPASESPPRSKKSSSFPTSIWKMS